MAGFTDGDVADEAELGVAGGGDDEPGVLPDRPTATGPCTLMPATMSRLTLPTRTMRAMSTVSASVTRRPSRNSGILPRRSMSCADLRAAAVHDDGAQADSCAAARRPRRSCSNRSGSSMALPPNFTTTVAPRKRRMYGSASTSTCARVPASITSCPCSRRRRRG